MKNVENLDPIGNEQRTPQPHDSHILDNVQSQGASYNLHKGIIWGQMVLFGFLA